MRSIAVILVCAGCLVAAPAGSHPHAWIDLESGALLDDQGRLTGIEIDWRFDAFYTAFVLDGTRPDQARQADLDKLAAENIGNLKDYSYFTEIEVDGQRQAVAPVDGFKTAMRGDQLWLHFVVPVATPVAAAAGHRLRYAVYDPTYFIEIRHVSKQAARVTGPGSTGCQTRLVEPRPPMEAIALAAGLDMSESGGDSLGRLFAEWVTVTCPTAPP